MQVVSDQTVAVPTIIIATWMTVLGTIVYSNRDSWAVFNYMRTDVDVS